MVVTYEELTHERAATLRRLHGWLFGAAQPELAPLRTAVHADERLRCVLDGAVPAEGGGADLSSVWTCRVAPKKALL